MMLSAELDFFFPGDEYEVKERKQRGKVYIYIYILHCCVFEEHLVYGVGRERQLHEVLDVLQTTSISQTFPELLTVTEQVFKVFWNLQITADTYSGAVAGIQESMCQVKEGLCSGRGNI